MKEELLKIEGAFNASPSFVNFQIGGRTLIIDCEDGCSMLDNVLLTNGATTEDMVSIVTLLLRTND